MSIIKKVEADIKNIIKDAGYEIEDFTLQVSNRPDLGDYQINDCMNLARTYKENPRIIAEKIVEKLSNDDRFVNIGVAGPGFINISLSDSFLVDVINELNEDIENNIDKVDAKKLFFDYGGANVSKALHVGHLRSANLGESLKRLSKLLGCEVISDAHLGDFGRPLGLVIKEIKEMYPELPYFDENYNGSYDEIDLPITNSDLEEIYPKASLKAKEDEEYLEDARILTVKFQKHEKGIYDLWKRIIEISKKEIKPVYDKLNVYYDLWEGESDSSEYVPELIKIFDDKNLLEVSDGATIVNVKKDEDNSPMPPVLLLTSTGATSYQATDLATILERKKKFNPDEIWYLADGRQSLHFEQVFRATRLAGLVDENVKLEHIPFGTMNGSDGKPFKTRDGGVMSLKEFIKTVEDATRERINRDIVEEDKIDETVEKIAISALKYADFIPFRTTDYIFNIDKFSDVEGKTGPYLLYSTVRIKSLLNKASNINYKNSKLINNETDRDIIITLLQMPQILKKSYENKSLNDIAEYIYLLTSKYNKLYAENKILLEENLELQESWLVLTSVVYKVNNLLLDILGLQVPEKM